MPARRSALEVSFPDIVEELREEEDAETEFTGRPTSAPSSTRKDTKRKKANSLVEARTPKRRHSAPDKENSGPIGVKYYVPKDNVDEIPEDKAYINLGEDPDADDGEEKPVRLLNDFCIFDPKHAMELISLDELEKDDGLLDREVEGAGDVVPFITNDEDAGQEDDLDDEQISRVRLSAIMRYTIDYTQDDEPVWIETIHAWYILQKPSKRYNQHFRAFYKPLRIAQIVISSVMEDKYHTLEDFLASFVRHNVSGRTLVKDDIWDAVPDIQAALEGLDNGDELSRHPVLHGILQKGPSISRGAVNTRHLHRPSHPRVQKRQLAGNIDLAVLRRENQTATHVTPRIDSYAHGLFREQLCVVGPPPVRSRGPSPAQERDMRARLLLLLGNALEGHRPNIELRRENRVNPGSFYVTEVKIDNEVFDLGDCVIVPIGQDGKHPAPKLPHDPRAIQHDKTLADFFWFAKIIHIDGEDQTTHVQWYEHSSKTAMGEICDPREVFLTEICDVLDLQCIVGKATVHSYDFVSGSPPAMSHHDFYCKLVYDSNTATYKDIDMERMNLAESTKPPDNCPVCLLSAQRDREEDARLLSSGIAWHGVNYHIHDFAMTKAERGPCYIGQIIHIRFRTKSGPIVKVKLLGRVSSIKAPPEDVTKDERHVFLTDDELDVELDNFIGQCYIVHPDSIPDLQSWLSHSPRHFYCRYKFPSLEVRSWSQRKQLLPRDIVMCGECIQEKTAEVRRYTEYFASNKPLRTFDPFGGVGAFGLGLEQAGCVKVTHAVEISPSASRTLRMNSPDTVVYNECANKVLKYAIKAHEGHSVEKLSNLFDGTPLPPPPKPEDIDCIIAGFPCQPHSRMNMFQKANDIKSNLILNVLSWVDFLKPRFCIFENVRGFLSFNLNATQAGIHRVEGGIEMGGLKFVIRALVEMSYQVRFGLLQAAHYGTPQSRVRFFVIAAKHGHPLPNLPQPTHDFTLADSLKISLSNGCTIEPIRTMAGTAPHHFVTVDDAIGDLPRFNWKNPGKERAHGNDDPRFLSIKCDNTLAKCGPRDPVDYHYEPKTYFQERCRAKRALHLQHFTRTYAKSKVERVVNIPLDPQADYRSLQPDLWEWQFANPASAVARSGFRPGLYGRLDKNGWFSTTVTNMDPTAKQSRVLNPYCKRIVTVRELARSQGFPDNFEFYSINDNVVTMHRQIGNAVPINVGFALGRELCAVLVEQWRSKRENIIMIE